MFNFIFQELGKHLCVMMGALVPLVETNDEVADQVKEDRISHIKY